MNEHDQLVALQQEYENVMIAVKDIHNRLIWHFASEHRSPRQGEAARAELIRTMDEINDVVQNEYKWKSEVS